MFDSKKLRRSDEAESGFTLIEVLISILITMIVMASVFALLTRGQRSFQREPEIADLQQSARTVLDIVSRDILQAGAGLPPEFPSFSIVRGGDGAPADRLEMIGMFQLAGELYLDPEDVASVGGTTVFMEANTTNFEIGDIVVLYNDGTTDLALTPNGPLWVMARVIDVVEDEFDLDSQAQVTYDPSEFGAYSQPPATMDDANFFAGGDFRMPKMTRVSIVYYDTVLDDPTRYSGPPPLVIQREVDNSGTPQAVGYLEDFQISYIIGVTAPAPQDNPPNPAVDLAGVPLTTENMLAGVRVTVTARSVSAGMEGASEGGAGREDDFIRRTFSTNVNPRNVTAGLDIRMMSVLAGS